MSVGDTRDDPEVLKALGEQSTGRLNFCLLRKNPSEEGDEATFRVLLTPLTVEAVHLAYPSNADEQCYWYYGPWFKDQSFMAQSVEMTALAAPLTNIPPLQTALDASVQEAVKAGHNLGFAAGFKAGREMGHDAGLQRGKILGRNEGRRLEREAALKEGFLAGQQAGVRACQLFHLLDAAAFLVVIRQLAPGFDQGLLPTSGPSLESEDFGDPSESPSASMSTADADLTAISDDQHMVTAPVLASDLEVDTPPTSATRAANVGLQLADDSLMRTPADDPERVADLHLRILGEGETEPDSADQNNPNDGAGTTH